MKQYFQIMHGTWAEYMTYRLNFVMWRLRVVIQMIVTYFLWWAIFASRNEFFGYSQAMILTYVLGSSLVRTIVLGTTTMDIGDIINQGDLSNYLIRPLNFFGYYIARDIADKGLNCMFALVEILLLSIILRPPLFIQYNPIILIFACVAIAIGMCLYFFFSLLLGFLGFWIPDVWGPRFISFVIMEFFAGGLFPLDILPKPLYGVSQSLPFFYFIYFPIKIYLGQLSIISMLSGLGVGILWIFALAGIASVMWRIGLRVYTAEGK